MWIHIAVSMRANPDALSEIYIRLFAVLAAEYPDYVELSGDDLELRHLSLHADLGNRQHITLVSTDLDNEGGLRVLEWINAQAGLARLGDLLALAVQEDIVIMRRTDDGRHFAESLHVLLPSRWVPREKLMQAFDTIHVPVAESHRLMSSAGNVMKAITTKGPYCRFGVSLTTLNQLDIHPAHPKPWDDAWLDDPDELARNVTLRVERQTTLPFADLGRALFTVRIYTTPLTEIARTRPDLLPRLATMIREASPAVLEYKGFAHYAPQIATWCESQTMAIVPSQIPATNI